MVYNRNRKSALKKAPVRKMVKRAFKKTIVSKSVKAYVKKAIHVAEENKTPSTLTQTNVGVVPMTSSTWGTLINCSDLWNLALGTGQGDRIGNKIHPVKWNIRGALYVTAGQNIPMLVKMYVFKLKSGYASPSAGAAVPSDFFQLGNTTVSPAGTMADNFRVVNSDKYKLYAQKTFKLGPSNGVNYVNNDYKSTILFSVDLLKYQKHGLSYNDGTTTPTNSGLYIAFTSNEIDDTPITLGAIRLAYDVNGQYENA